VSSMESSQSAVNKNYEIYYTGKYWNDYKSVQEYINRNYTGDAQKTFVSHFQENYGGRVFENALIINCGNGWFERQLIDEGIMRKATAFDYSIELLQEAVKNRGHRNILYFQADVNRVDFRKNSFDLIVNHAAMHHVQYIDRLCRILCKSITADGVFLNQDYIGPGRNQYSYPHWSRIKSANRTLPVFLRKEPLFKPHLPTMLSTDPTEAIHSEMIVEAISRYFEIVEKHDTNGGVAYEILTHNDKLRSRPEKEVYPYVQDILRMDKKLTDEGKVPVLFSYFVAKPMKEMLSNKSRLQYFQVQEETRERWAKSHGGVYTYSDWLRNIGHATYWKIKGLYLWLAAPLKNFMNNKQLFCGSAISAPLEDFAQQITTHSDVNALVAGATVIVPVNIKNVSNNCWPAGGVHPVRLSYHWLNTNGSVVEFDGERTILPCDVKVNRSLDIMANIKVPDCKGKHTLRITMVQELVSWFDDKNGNSLNIEVNIVES